MKLTKIKDIKNKKILYQLWNHEYGFIYPISDELFERNIENIYDDASFVAIKDKEIVGFIIGKIWENDYPIKSYGESAWISLIYVVPSYRKQGIGTMLINETCLVFKKLDKKIVFLGKDIHNFFPGLPVDLIKYKNFFQNRGFEFLYQTHDLISRNEKKLLIKNNNCGFCFRTATLDDKDKLIEFISTNWPGRWTYETIEYFNYGGVGNEYLICLNSKNEICAFAKICYPNTKVKLMSNSFTWHKRFKTLGGIGPLGVAPTYRGNYLGYDIVASSVNKLIDYHVTEIIIDWTGLLEFYRQMGFEVWKSYFYMNKKIN